MREKIGGIPERDNSNPPYSVMQNVAFALINIDGKSFSVGAAIGKRQNDEGIEGNPLVPGPFKHERKFDHRKDDNNMLTQAMWCTEPKILEHVMQELDPENSKGEIKLFTERPPCDEGCKEFLKRFRDKYKHVELTVTHDPEMKEKTE
ncbi:MAG: deaminase domain-containing protein [Halobacteria archaeon]|nr:deaminase domain-containing protein [Halobacteria archaeon]